MQLEATHSGQPDSVWWKLSSRLEAVVITNAELALSDAWASQLLQAQ